MDGLIPDGPLKQRLKEAGTASPNSGGPHHKGNEEPPPPYDPGP